MRIRLLLRHKILILVAGSIIALTVGTMLTTWRTLDRTASQVEDEGKTILSRLTEQFLESVVRQNVQTLDEHLSQVKSTAGYAGSFLSDHIDRGPMEAPFIEGFLLTLQRGVGRGISIYVISNSGDIWFRLDREERIDKMRAVAVVSEQLGAVSLFDQRSGETVWGPVHASPLSSTYDLAVDAMSPIYKGGKPWGFVGVSVSLTHLIAQFNQHPPVPSSYSFLMDGEQHLLAAPPHGRVDLASPVEYKPRGVISLTQTGDPELNAALQHMALGGSSVRSVSVKGDRKYLAYYPLDSIDWRMGSVVSVSMVTGASGQLASAVEGASGRALFRTLMTTALLLAVALTVGALLTHRLVKPLREMTLATERIVGGHFDQRVSVTSTDEIGALGTMFNAMATHIKELVETLEERVEERTSELREAQRRLIDAAHKAGMAEVATSVLHNVGNVLTSVTVAAATVSDQVKTSRLAALRKLSDLLQSHSGDLATFFTHDERGKLVPAYIEKLAAQFGVEQSSIQSGLATLDKNIDHIRHIIAMQQNYARGTKLAEAVSLVELIDDAVRINSAGLERHEVRLVREFTEVHKVTVERHKVLQILVNLVSNAKYALSESTAFPKLVTIRLDQPDSEKVRIVVADNGVGISEDNMGRIFQYGFTTRISGHGFGLHSSAIAAQEMGGSLSVQSDGPGKGATFTLELPCAPVSSQRD
ncbi:ATP-binding protein [Pendulispora brunnea]|uniref:histidine kinase n=1 Tax=Pendulispora brunnea TaxID=2905690 RepID=A0ABZ2JXJ6_9BACT